MEIVLKRLGKRVDGLQMPSLSFHEASNDVVLAPLPPPPQPALFCLPLPCLLPSLSSRQRHTQLHWRRVGETSGRRGSGHTAPSYQLALTCLPLLQERMKAFEAEREFYSKFFSHMVHYTTHDAARTARSGRKSSRATLAAQGAQTGRSVANSVSFADSPGGVPSWRNLRTG